eukprot:12885789-Prorocentrum_lima.AAC.1
MHRAINAIGASKQKPKKQFKFWASEAERLSGVEPSVEIEVSASHIRIACMNGRRRAVIVSNTVASYLR